VKELLSSGRFEPTKVITHSLPLADFATDVELAVGGKTGKILLYL